MGDHNIVSTDVSSMHQTQQLSVADTDVSSMHQTQQLSVAYTDVSSLYQMQMLVFTETIPSHLLLLTHNHTHIYNLSNYQY